MSLAHAILGFLATEDQTGYDLKTRCFDDKASHFWTADQAQIYRTLDRLEAMKLVEARLKVQRGRPDRNVYRVTQAGRDYLDSWLTEHHPSPALRDPFLIQIAFADQLPDDAVLALLQLTRDEHQEKLSDLRGRRKTFAERTKGRRDRTVQLEQMTYDAALTRQRATIDWLDDCIETIQGEVSDHGDPQRRLFRTEE